METGESSWLLLLLAAGVTGLMALVACNRLRRLQVSEQALLRWRALALLGPVATAGAVLGTGLCASPILALGAEGLNFPLGYAYGSAPLLWLGGCAGATLLALLPAWSRRAPVLWLAGALLGLLAVSLQCGWIHAAGFRPGVAWRTPFVAAAVVLQAVVFGLALWMSLSTTLGGNDRPRSWQVGAAAILALGTALTQQLVIAAADLAGQLGSVYARQLPGTWLCVLAGAGVPMACAFLLLHQALQGPSRKRGGRRQFENLHGSARKQRRRHRIPTL